MTGVILNASEASSAAAARGVPNFLYDVLNEDYIPAEGPSMSRWFDYFWTTFANPADSSNTIATIGAIQSDCTKIDGALGSCQTSANCSVLMEAFFTQFAITNFVRHMVVFELAWKDAVGNVTDKLDQVAADFPVQVPQLSSAAVFNTFGAGLSILGGATSLFPETTLFGGAAGVMGSIFSDIGANIPPAVLAEDLKTYLSDTLGNISSQVQNNAGHLLTAVIQDGDLSAYPASLYPSTEFSSQPIAAFFDNGNFITVPTGWTEQALWPVMTQQLLQAIVGAALVIDNYYIMGGSYTVADCPMGVNDTGVIINSTCYTLEKRGPGSSELTLATQTTFSQQMAPGTVYSLINYYNISLGDIYSSSVGCQLASNAYNTPVNFYANGFDVSFNPPCLYNLPVLQGVPVTDQSGVVSASPCNELLANSTSKTTVIGATYLPTNLENIFTSEFCLYDNGNNVPHGAP